MRPICPFVLRTTLTALALIILPATHAATKFWTNPAGGDWATASNWSPTGVPDNGDTVLITADGTYSVTLTSGTTPASLTLGGGAGTQSLVVTSGTLKATNLQVAATGLLELRAGGLSGQLTVNPGGQLLFASTANKTLYQCSLTNLGTVTWSGGLLQTGSTPGTSIDNRGLWDITSDVSMQIGIYGDTARFLNSGTLRKSGGTGLSRLFSLTFINTGSVEILAGTLDFPAAIQSELGGTFSVAQDAALSLSSGSWLESGATFTGPGTSTYSGNTLTLRTNILPGLTLAGGDVTIAPPFQNNGAITNLTLSGSRLTGTNSISGTLLVNSGGLSGQLTVNPGGHLIFASTANKTLYQCSLTNLGTVTWSGGLLQTGSTPGTSIDNRGLWDITSDVSMQIGIYGDTARFLNSGTLRKSGGTGLSRLFSLTFINTGSVEILAGTLDFPAAIQSELGGTFSVAQDAALSLSSGSWLESGATFTGPGASTYSGNTLTLRTNILPGLTLAGGDVTIAPPFQNNGAITNLTLSGSRLTGTNSISGTLLVNSGGLTGQLTVNPGGHLIFASTANKTLYQCSLTNLGTVTWSGGLLQTGSTPGTSIDNRGLWDITSDVSMQIGIYGDTARFLNSGTLRKSGGTGLSRLFSLTFINTGSVEILAGTLDFPAAIQSELGGTFSVAQDAALSLSSGSWLESGATFTGPGTSTYSGNTLTLRTNILPGLTLAGGDVTIAPPFQNNGAITNLTLSGSRLTGTNSISGTLLINSGGLTGQLTVNPGGQLLFASTANKTLYQCSLTNLGTVTWSGGLLQTGSTPGTSIDNRGLWDITSDVSMQIGIYGDTARFLNSGTLRKSGGTGLSRLFSLTFINTGSVEILAGTLDFPAAIQSELGGTFSVAQDAALSLSSGSWLESGATFTGPGTSTYSGNTLTLRTNILPGLTLAGGDVTIAPPFQNNGAITNLTLSGSRLTGTNSISGTLLVNSGGLTGQLTVNPGGHLIFASTANKTLYQCSLTNLGTVTWSGGLLQTGSTPGTSIDNRGLWDITSDVSMQIGIYGDTARFLNSGTLRKSGGTGLSRLHSLLLENPGLIVLDAGTFDLPAGFTNRLGVLHLRDATITTPGTLVLESGRLQGNGSVGSFLATGGSVLPGTNGFGILNFQSGLTLTNGATLSVALTGSTPGSSFGQLVVKGTTRLAGSLLQITDVSNAPIGSQYALIDNDATDPVVGGFQSMADGSLFTADGQLLRVWYGRGTGNDVLLIRDDGGVALRAAGLNTNGFLTVQGRGTNFASYTILAATNLWDPDWVVIGTTPADAGGLFQFIDSDTNRFPMRFYRSDGP